MKDVIKLLPDSVANQIAAGEVIQRPASVIKELVENAVDAGATDIRIYIKDAGRTLIQVIDNGCGMSNVDARMAFERHATSKIRRADDLFQLRTMGFRGEALPSICAISQVEVKTRTEDAPMGVRLVINGSKVEAQEPCVCERGTSMSVKNIFFNVPARRKFLKSDNVELSNIMREFERLALVNNNIRMSIDTGVRQLDLRAATLHQRIHDIWKNNLKMQLLPVDIDTQLVKVHGFVSRPEFARRRNALQFLIVNGRNMRHPYFHKAIVSCFDGLIATDTQPCYFLKFEVDPASIDVNIHPTKNEIKFEYESEIWPLLVAGVKASLGKNSAVPSIDFNADAVPVAPVAEGETVTPPHIDLPEDYNPFNSVRTVGYNPGFASPQSSGGGSGFGGHCGNNFGGSDPNLRNWEKLYSDFMAPESAGITRAQDITGGYMATGIADDAGNVNNGNNARIPGLEDDPAFRSLCMQISLKYIITPSREGMMVIDQHRAHVKVLYEQYRATARAEKMVSQRVMFPETITLEPEQQNALTEVDAELRKLGFELEYEDGDTWKITAIPSTLRGCDPKDVVMRILDSVIEDSANYGKDQQPVESLLDRLCLLMARSAAITRGRRLGEEEMEHLVGELFALPDPTFTPNGNRIYAIIDEGQLGKIL